MQPDIVMDNDDSKDGSKDEEEAVDPLEEHEKRLQLVARRRNEEKKGEADKTDEAKNWFLKIFALKIDNKCSKTI